MAVGVKPMLFMRRRQFAHSTTRGVTKAGLRFKRVIDLEKPVVSCFAISVEENLYGAEALVDGIKEFSIVLRWKRRSIRRLCRRPSGHAALWRHRCAPAEFSYWMSSD